MVSDILSRVRSMHMSLGDGDPEELLEAAFPISLKAIFSVFSILLELLFYFPVWKPWLYLSTLLYILSPKDIDIQSQESGGQIEDKSNKIVTPSTFWGCHLPWLENWAPCPQFRLLRLRLPLCWYFRATVGSPRGGHEWREVGKLFVYSPWALGDTQDQEDCPSCRDWCQDGKEVETVSALSLTSPLAEHGSTNGKTPPPQIWRSETWGHLLSWTHKINIQGM